MEIVTKFAPFVLFYIMLGIGMSTNIKNFVEILKNLKVLLIGLISQIIILPCIGFLFAIFVTNDPALKVGIILITSMPSAVSSNYITKLANGNIALSVSLTAVSAILSFITIPFIFIVVSPMIISEATILQDLNFLKMSVGLLLMTTVPVLIGIIINTRFSIFAEKISKFFSYSSLFLFLLVIFGAWISEWSTINQLYKSLGLLLVFLTATILIIVNILVNIFNLNLQNKRTIIIETLIQNGAMAIIVGELTLGFGGGYMSVAAVYALLQYKLLSIWWATKKFATNI
ncbi:bile acid:sodium symporter [Pelagibacteraceae bacterium]|jgi:BASS family bile acid:Na+ symporter|nr:bile acid:sodium symporter [Pelagibacteraceae bacterium]